jgi:VIT1/CCC1 family predicted Fe2+/Mn2+ transporter
MPTKADIDRYRSNLRAELDGAVLYRAIAESERDAGRRGVLLELARAETGHAAHWRDKLRAAGAPEPRFAPSLRTRLLAALARRFGPGFVMPSLAATVPVLPFVWGTGRGVIWLSVGCTALALAAIGWLTSLFNGRSPTYSAARQMLFGCAAAAATYGIGRLLGVSLS